jgi:hypothetical protein
MVSGAAVHDDANSDQADRRADEVVPVGTKPVENHTPDQRAGDETPP